MIKRKNKVLTKEINLTKRIIIIISSIIRKEIIREEIINREIIIKIIIKKIKIRVKISKIRMISKETSKVNKDKIRVIFKIRKNSQITEIKKKAIDLGINLKNNNNSNNHNNNKATIMEQIIKITIEINKNNLIR
jgi:hypothetical protein